MPKLEKEPLGAARARDIAFEHRPGWRRRPWHPRRLSRRDARRLAAGRPDDGTDVTTFNNIEFFVQLKPEGVARGLTKQKLIQQMDAQLSRFPA